MRHCVLMVNSVRCEKSKLPPSRPILPEYYSIVIISLWLHPQEHENISFALGTYIHSCFEKKNEKCENKDK